MVFVKFHNMNRKKKNFLMSPLNSKKIFFSLYNKSKQCYNHSSKMFSFLFFFFFNLCTVYFTKNVCSFFLFFFHMLCSTMFKFLFLSSFSPFSLSCSFLFWFSFLFFFFHFFFTINCSFNVPLFFFQPYIYLSVFTLTR